MLSKQLHSRLLPRAIQSRGFSVWSGELSFASPESDFGASRPGASATTAHQRNFSVWSGELSFASPESDFAATRGIHVQAANPPSVVWSNALSFSSPESDFCAEMEPAVKPLPRTLREALVEAQQAIVVTTAFAPHRIVYVNSAWENLCEFKQKEVLHKQLKIIQGSDTNTELAQKMVDKVQTTGDEQDAYLINYTKSGKRFTNHLRAGPLFLNSNDKEPEFMVGVLEEVDPRSVPIRLVY